MKHDGRRARWVNEKVDPAGSAQPPVADAEDADAGRRPSWQRPPPAATPGEAWSRARLRLAVRSGAAEAVGSRRSCSKPVMCLCPARARFVTKPIVDAPSLPPISIVGISQSYTLIVSARRCQPYAPPALRRKRFVVTRTAACDSQLFVLIGLLTRPSRRRWRRRSVSTRAGVFLATVAKIRVR